MAFKDSLRLEQIYFQKLKDMIKTCKAWYDGENTDKDRDILEGLIQSCAAILLLYRNLGEEWNELTALIQKTMHDLVDLKDKTDAYHDELNEKIDEVNNYLNAAITVIEAEIDAFGGLPSNASAAVGDVLTKGANGNEWTTPSAGGGNDDNIILPPTTLQPVSDVYHLPVSEINLENFTKCVSENNFAILSVIFEDASTEETTTEYKLCCLSYHGIYCGQYDIVFDNSSRSYIFDPVKAAIEIGNDKNVTFKIEAVPISEGRFIKNGTEIGFEYFMYEGTSQKILDFYAIDSLNTTQLNPDGILKMFRSPFNRRPVYDYTTLSHAILCDDAWQVIVYYFSSNELLINSYSIVDTDNVFSLHTDTVTKTLT